LTNNEYLNLNLAKKTCKAKYGVLNKTIINSLITNFVATKLKKVILTLLVAYTKAIRFVLPCFVVESQRYQQPQINHSKNDSRKCMKKLFLCTKFCKTI